MAMKIRSGHTSILTQIPTKVYNRYISCSRQGGYRVGAVYRLALMWAMQDKGFVHMIQEHLISPRTTSILSARKRIKSAERGYTDLDKEDRIGDKPSVHKT